MNAVAVWQAMRTLRWLAWFGLIFYVIYFQFTRSQHFNQFGNLTPWAEFLIFALAVVPSIIGLFEMMARDWAGVPRKPPR